MIIIHLKMKQLNEKNEILKIEFSEYCTNNSMSHSKKYQFH
jgi:hypothetical protein